MNEVEFDILLRRYLDDSITDPELDTFLNYIATLDNDSIVEKIDRVLEEKDIEQNIKLIPLLHPTKKKNQRVRIYAVAASLLFFLAVGLFWSSDMWVDKFNLNASLADDILMSESEIIVRSSTGDVKLLNQKDSIYRLGMMNIRVDEAGQISYALSNDQAVIDEEITIHIPKGKTSFLKLSDGSKVWLNSNTEISFNSHFEADNRIVRLSGEAYFEVKRDESRPFIIHAETHDVEVLGTSFNVSSYRGMTARTTLVNGSVRIKHESGDAILKPLQQFSARVDGSTSVATVDAVETLAWRDGRFVFDRMHLKDILLYLSNWYPIEDIKVERWTDDVFTGVFTQDRSLKNILDKLAKTSSYEFQIHNGVLEISVTQ